MHHATLSHFSARLRLINQIYNIFTCLIIASRSDWRACPRPPSAKVILVAVVQDIYFSCMYIRKYVPLYFLISETDSLKSLWYTTKIKSDAI